MRIEGFVNFRDTGGIPLTAGEATRPGVLFRSDAPSALTAQGLSELAATPIGVVVDFRTELERRSAPDVLPATRPVRLVQLEVLEGALPGLASVSRDAVPDARQLARIFAALPTLGDLYVAMLVHGAGAFAEVARLVAGYVPDEPSAVLVHCTAGKDRTGVAVALLLDAVGARRDAIVADYASSADNLAGPWTERVQQGIAALGVPLTPAVVELTTGTPPEAIERALAWVDAKHGGSAQYLRSGGLTEADLEGLRRALVG
ncbi:tyrosine-protein phosphatase [Microbacterium immunditiarum]|uniref:Protein-tyrosine phosphatase n=1 Tax=Microbacterium immunditiarum TaxID=337480 RepID=A0A7Y9KKV5_9MICO|nr:protein-tyrosine phosphatase [Microbacterium immunditiarum]